LFNFHPDKWRIIYRVNAGETKEEAASEKFVHALIKDKFPEIQNYKFLWASVFRLGQGQSNQYSSGRVVLAGDAAHPMGPSAGAGMMVGMLGVWRLAWRLKEATKNNENTFVQKTFSDYETEQRQGSKAIQRANATTFAQISLSNKFGARLRDFGLNIISGIRAIQRKMVIADTLTNQLINYKNW